MLGVPENSEEENDIVKVLRGCRVSGIARGRWERAALGGKITTTFKNLGRRKIF